MNYYVFFNNQPVIFHTIFNARAYAILILESIDCKEVIIYDKNKKRYEKIIKTYDLIAPYKCYTKHKEVYRLHRSGVTYLN